MRERVLQRSVSGCCLHVATVSASAIIDMFIGPLLAHSGVEFRIMIGMGHEVVIGGAIGPGIGSVLLTVVFNIWAMVPCSRQDILTASAFTAQLLTVP